MCFLVSLFSLSLADMQSKYLIRFKLSSEAWVNKFKFRNFISLNTITCQCRQTDRAPQSLIFFFKILLLDILNSVLIHKGNFSLVACNFAFYKLIFKEGLKR